MTFLLLSDDLSELINSLKASQKYYQVHLIRKHEAKRIYLLAYLYYYKQFVHDVHNVYMPVGWDVKWCPMSRITTPLAQRSVYWILMKSRLVRAARETSKL